VSKYPPDVPLRLDVAVREAFPAGGMTVSGLRKEIARGRLTVEKIAGKHFVTLAAIQRMRELCRIVEKPNLQRTSRRVPKWMLQLYAPQNALELRLKKLREEAEQERQERQEQRKNGSQRATKGSSKIAP
jgi:hypothetical protein